MLETDEQAITAKLELKTTEPATNMEKLKWEKAYLGLYVSSHPLQGMKKYISKKAHLISNLKRKDFGKKVVICGLIAQYRKIFTKNGAYMASFVIEDPTGKLDVIVFPKAYQKYGHVFKEDEVIVMGGKLDNKRGQVQFICDDAKAVSLENMIKKAKEDGVYDPKDKVILLTPNFDKDKAETPPRADHGIDPAIQRSGDCQNFPDRSIFRYDCKWKGWLPLAYFLGLPGHAAPVACARGQMPPAHEC